MKAKQDKEVLNPREAAQVLGINLQTVYRRLRDGSLPSRRLGHLILIPRKALDRFLAAESRAA
jgi:excisionase family DNA binding protein